MSIKAVRQKSTGKIIYREVPDFEDGKGIINVVKQKKISKDDLEEVEITQKEWDSKDVIYKGKIIESEDDIREYNKNLLMTADNMEALVGAVAALATGGEIPAKFFHALQEVADATQEAKDLLIANNMKDR